MISRRKLIAFLPVAGLVGVTPAAAAPFPEDSPFHNNYPYNTDIQITYVRSGIKDGVGRNDWIVRLGAESAASEHECACRIWDLWWTFAGINLSPEIATVWFRAYPDHDKPYWSAGIWLFASHLPLRGAVMKPCFRNESHYKETAEALRLIWSHAAI